jgi:uncharacterized protein YndB with AHSA1/START domain
MTCLRPIYPGCVSPVSSPRVTEWSNMSSKPPVPIRVTRRFNQSPERVFDAWLDRDKVKQWFAPGLGEMVRVEIDARVGGSFSFVQRRDGAEVDHIGTYLEMDRPRRLAFTWSARPSKDSSRVDIEIVPQGTGCELALTHELHPDWANYASRTEAAWTKMLDAMAEAVK